MTRTTLLQLGAILCLLIAFGHFSCLFFLESAFVFYGIEDLYECLNGIHFLLPYLITLMLVGGFILAGLYGLAAAGNIRMPFTRMAVRGIVILLLLRWIAGLYLLLFAHHADIEHGHCILIACLLISYGCGWNPIENSPEAESNDGLASNLR